MKKRFTDEQIIGFLKQADGGIPVGELCHQHGFSDASFYTWRARFGGCRYLTQTLLFRLCLVGLKKLF
ncbi:putative transposase [Nitrosospira multiformis]|uniref:Putative transposase n=1 Tax=Nitrosospira multiformis TaxID=1231 RepID=A0A1H9YGF6_9PROT|nr:putative transposase [Nitrosospira multiformis]